MCRCYNVVVKDNADIKVSDIVINYAINSYQGNRDGFFIEFDNKFIRTLDFTEYMKFILNHRNEIDESKSVHAHLRACTHGGVNHKWIHGWRFKSFYCSHNGVLHTYRKIKEFQNDSYTFFYNVFTCANSINKIIKNSKELLEDIFGGSGVFIMTNSRYSIYISFNKDIHLHLLNDSVLCVLSQDDIHKFEDKHRIIVDKEVKESDLGLVKFQRIINKVKEISTETISNIESDDYMRIENEILVINHDKFKFTKRIEIDTWRNRNRKERRNGTLSVHNYVF